MATDKRRLTLFLSEEEYAFVTAEAGRRGWKRRTQVFYDLLDALLVARNEFDART